MPGSRARRPIKAPATQLIGVHSSNAKCQDGFPHNAGPTVATTVLQGLPPREGQRGDPCGFRPNDPVQHDVHLAPRGIIPRLHANAFTHGRLLSVLRVVIVASRSAGHSDFIVRERRSRQTLDSHVAHARDSTVCAGMGMPIHWPRGV